MIKQTIKYKLRFILWSSLAFGLSYFFQINLAIPLFLIALCIYLNVRGIELGDKKILNLTLLFLIIFTTGYFIIKNGWSIYYIPFPLIPMLATLLFNNLELSLVLGLGISVPLGYISDSPFQMTLLILTSATISSILVFNARKRNTIIRAGLLVGIIQVIMLVFFERFQLHLANSNSYLILLLNGILSSIVVLGVLPVFEYLFNRLTNISLLELADFNHPLLQRLIIEAPGTYHHSLIVGNLSESASLAVGANALLARIGAYYHDIGKLQKPEYFSENQSVRSSKHDTLSPSMSKLIIMNHVKEGIELAKKFKLSEKLIDFIQQHHGTSLVYYFYRRALENQNVEEKEITEEGFRYPGPKPTTKETAIVLLADSVEAATRALKEPTPAKIEETVHKIVNNKFIDGQLDECNLTLKDLERISAVFIRILTSMHHNRVTYPEDSKTE